MLQRLGPAAATAVARPCSSYRSGSTLPPRHVDGLGVRLDPTVIPVPQQRLSRRSTAAVTAAARLCRRLGPKARRSSWRSTQPVLRHVDRLVSQPQQLPQRPNLADERAAADLPAGPRRGTGRPLLAQLQWVEIEDFLNPRTSTARSSRDEPQAILPSKIAKSSDGPLAILPPNLALVDEGGVSDNPLAEPRRGTGRR